MIPEFPNTALGCPCAPLRDALRRAFSMPQQHKSRVPSKMIARAREFRHAMTPAEELLWSRLRNRGLGAKFRRQRPIGRFIADFYCAAARAYDIQPQLLTAFILAEQRDQTLVEDAKDYVAAVSIARGNTSTGLGQVVVSTALDNDLFSDLLTAQSIQDLGHTDIARRLASDEFNIFATARYIRSVADQGASIDISQIPYTHQSFPGLDLQAYSQTSASRPADNIRALASEYTTLPWDNGASEDSPGWGYLVLEAYHDVVDSGVFR